MAQGLGGSAGAGRPPLDVERVRSNLAAVEERIETACTRAGRDRDAVALLAATKYVSNDEMGVLVEADIRLVGENVAADLVAKHERWGHALTFDFIGHLQSRKTADVLPLVRLIHSVESESVLRRLERHATGAVRVLLEVNVADEPSKYGLAPGEVDAFLEKASAYPSVSFGGLMTMPPLAAAPEDARPYFSALRELGDRLRRDWAPRHDFVELSMGTSQDFAVAVEEGATLLRLGGVLYA
jgi:pyridoxal phosphate enzyme (YggS family)